MQASRRFIQEQQGPGLARVEPSEVADELQALRFAARKGGQGLSQRQVAETYFLEDRQLLARGRASAQKGAHLGDRHRQQVADRLAVELEGQHLVPETFPVAGGAGQRDVGHELHLDGFPTRAAAAFAAAFAGVEREVRRRQAGGLGFFGIAEQVADGVPSAHVERRIRTRGARGRRLVDERDFFVLAVELELAGTLG